MKSKTIKVLLSLLLVQSCFFLASCNKALPNKLSAPQNLQALFGELTWDGVEYADGYAVYIDGVEYETSDCRYDLSALDQSGVYSIEVMAYSNRGIAHSEISAMSYRGKFAPTDGLKYNNFNLSDNSCFLSGGYSANEYGICVIPQSYQGYKVTRWAGATFGSGEVYPDVKSLYFPHDLDIGVSSRFSGFPNLETIVFNGGNEKYYFQNGCLIKKADNSLRTGGVKAEIPESVTMIDAFAFENRNVKKIIVPNNVTKIEPYAFHNCKILENVVLPKKVAEGSVWFNTFNECSSLVRVALPDGISDLNYAFSGCSSLIQINVPEGVTNLTGAFANCRVLPRVILPKSTVDLEETFSNCASLVEISLPQGVRNLLSAFNGCTSLKSVVVPGSAKEVLSTFGNCTSLQSVVLEEGIETIGYGMKKFSLSLLPESYPYSVFENCIALTDVTLPSTLVKIDESSFSGCISLKSITIPENVESIQKNAFANCPLEEVYYKGSATEWAERVRADEKGNDTLLLATRYYYSETAPTEEGNYWRYVNGVPTKWNTAT